MGSSDTASNVAVPRHVAIIMDGNGRWAQRRFMPRVEGHRRGAQTVRLITEAAARSGVGYLTLFAFSSENWRRPADEVGALMSLFAVALKREALNLRDNGIQLRVAGELSRFSPEIQDGIRECEQMTANGRNMVLTVCANYGGRWDILSAMRSILSERPDIAKNPECITESMISEHLAFNWAPEVDLMIRTGGEQRISNFILWQAAYAELYTSSVLWPDFGPEELQKALNWYAGRERRFGMTGEQIQAQKLGSK